MLVALAALQLLSPPAGRYELVELSIPAPVAANPFDPNTARVDATITLPSGKSLRVPAFWYQHFTRSLQNPAAQGIQRVEQLAPQGQPGWRLRFSSPEAGPHRVSAVWTIDGREGHSDPLTVTIAESANPGYIRRSPRNPAYLEHSSGRPFFPIGENLCMYQNREGTYYYSRILPKLAQGRANYVRLWQEYYVPQDPSIVAAPGNSSFAGFPLETQATGLGRYDLASAWRLDEVDRESARHGIYYQLAFEMTVWWQTSQKHRWPRNPYNAANGGPCRTPQEYFTNEKARELVRRRLRYSVARWGWSAQLAAWELWNEVDNNEGFDPAANAAWHREMAAYLKSIDPWRHLITTSWRDPLMFAISDIDIAQGHSYWDLPYDAAQYTLQDSDHLMSSFSKPYFFGEQGVEDPALAAKLDPEGRHFHDTIWASALSGAAGTGLYWWWHNYIEPLDLYYHYQPLAAFLDGEDLPARSWRRPGLSRPSLPVTLQLHGLVASDRALLWLHDPLAFRIVDGKPETGPAQPAATLNFTGLADGEYAIQWWDTATGKIVREDQGRVRSSNHFGYGLELKPPPFRSGIAAKIIRRTRP